MRSPVTPAFPPLVLYSPFLRLKRRKSTKCVAYGCPEARRRKPTFKRVKPITSARKLDSDPEATTSHRSPSRELPFCSEFPASQIPLVGFPTEGPVAWHAGDPSLHRHCSSIVLRHAPGACALRLAALPRRDQSGRAEPMGTVTGLGADSAGGALFSTCGTPPRPSAGVPARHQEGPLAAGVWGGAHPNRQVQRHPGTPTKPTRRAAGAKPVWYVDAPSLASYKALGLTCKVGGKLVPARNMALRDAARLRKPCVQVSDDIQGWDYYVGDMGKAACRARFRRGARSGVGRSRGTGVVFEGCRVGLRRARFSVCL